MARFLGRGSACLVAWFGLACGGRFEHTPGLAGGAAGGGQNGLAGSSGSAGEGTAGASTNGVAFRNELRDKPIPLLDTRGGPSPASPGSVVRVGLDPSVVLRELPSSLVGINTAVWDGDEYLLSSTARARLAAVGTQLLRFPGGSSSDQYYWDGNVPSSLTGNPPMWTQPWAVSSGELATLGQELGALSLITVNYGDVRLSGLEHAIELAANWVEYCNAPNDGSNVNGGVDFAARRAADGFAAPLGVKYWEIGNESYGSWEAGYESDGATFGENAAAFAVAMKAADPTIFVGVPGDVGDPVTSEWTRAALATRLGRFVDFVDVHDYFTFTPLDSTSILGLTDQVQDNILGLRAVIGSAVPSRASNIAVYFGEFGCTLSDGAHESAAVSGLFIAHVLGEVMATGYDAASQWDVANGWPGFEPGPGDHGFLSAGSTIVPDFTPRPSYYAHYFFSRGFGDRLIRSLSTDAQVLVYASGYRTGTTVTVVLINQADGPRSVQLSPGRSGDHEFNSWVLAASDLDSMSVTLNGKGNGLPEGGPAIEQVIPYYSRVSGQALEFDLPPYSVTNVVIH